MLDLRKSYFLTLLGAIALVITPAILPQQFHGITHAQTNSPDWSDLFIQARDLEYADQYLEAENIYRQILSAPRPASLNDYMYSYIQIKFGQILQTQGKFEEAIEVLQGVINSPSSNIERQGQARQTLTRVLESQQNAAQNVARGLEEIRQDATTQRGYFDLARGLAAQGQLANGFTFLEAQLGRPLTLEAALEFARAANSRRVGGDISGSGYRSVNSTREDAIVLYRQLVNRYPANTTARAEFIELLRLVGRQAEVVALLQTDPSQSRFSRELARALEENGQAQEAIALYERLLSEYGEIPYIYMEFGAILERNQKFDQALQVYLAGIQRFPDDMTGYPGCHGYYRTSYDSLVQLLANQNRLDQILPIFEQSLPNAPSEAYTSLALSLAYGSGGRSLINTTREQYRIQAEAVNQRLRERYPDAESWQGRVETWRGGCGGSYY